ncbi:O-6 methyl-guanine alkyl transferase [Trypanosoma theileri]|uniref:Methylated-DNA--protein-cysteine methyltransferase n=1 Tax=Trypanosoma theileri TaxID=67003 RepID=A0A1X0P7S0_9TRYP|nr:O-6 methyl-guanine alkyl transferase [Trypanosoma theileri]ORC92881.1 O-6 methyl-guanine alkyl transferase [Trypanosoma theileri]
MSTPPLRLYRYTFPTPIGDFVLLIDNDGAVRLSNWTDCEDHAVERLRRAYKPQEIVIEVVDNKTEGTTTKTRTDETIITNNNDNSNNNNNNNDAHPYAVQQLKRYFDYPPYFNASTDANKDNIDINHRIRQEELQKLLDTVPIHYAPSTPFLRNVWTVLREVRSGDITTYGTLAKRCQHPNASRAVGYAMRENHICVLLPCHRVVGASQALTGFGSGLWRKVWLLRHEGAAIVGDAVKRKRSVVKMC